MRETRLSLTSECQAIATHLSAQSGPIWTPEVNDPEHGHRLHGPEGAVSIGFDSGTPPSAGAWGRGSSLETERPTFQGEAMMSNSIPDEQLLHECAEALRRLLASPELHLDGLEPSTRDAMAYAHSVLQMLNARRQAVYCVLCGELLPDVSFTDEDRGQLVAYAHRVCAEKAAQSAAPSEPS
jgi:hypothetical protein